MCGWPYESARGGLNESRLVTQFSELGLASHILKAVNAEGYTEPTPIQGKVIPVMMEGRDIVGIAQTGTGKTASFVLPLLNEIANDKTKVEAKHCRALILAPTRELAAQIADSIRTYGRHVRHSRAVIVGGVKAGPQIRTMAHGADIVVATPGRLEDLMSTGAIRLDTTTTVVLDEADQMLDLGFMPAIRRILGRLPRDRQTLMLSATMPKQIRSLAKDFLTKPVEISVAPTSRPIERIEQKVVLLEKKAKREALVKLLDAADLERAIVFTRTKRGADRVCEYLEKGGFSASAIHGNKSQNQREKALKAFKNGTVTILVATDIAARGIDVDGVSHVVNFELPTVAEVYVHRIGRTARAGASGVAITLCDYEERTMLREIEKLIGTSLHARDEEGLEVVFDIEAEKAATQLANKNAADKNNNRNRNPNAKGRNRKPKQGGGAHGGKPGTSRKAKSYGKPGSKPKTAKKNGPGHGTGQGKGQGPSRRQRAKSRSAA